MFFSLFGHSASVYRAPAICVMTCVYWVNRKVLKDSFCNNSYFLYSHTEMEDRVRVGRGYHIVSQLCNKLPVCAETEGGVEEIML